MAWSLLLIFLTRLKSLASMQLFGRGVPNVQIMKFSKSSINIFTIDVYNKVNEDDCRYDVISHNHAILL